MCLQVAWLPQYHDMGLIGVFLLVSRIYSMMCGKNEMCLVCVYCLMMCGQNEMCLPTHTRRVCVVCGFVCICVYVCILCFCVFMSLCLCVCVYVSVWCVEHVCGRPRGVHDPRHLPPRSHAGNGVLSSYIYLSIIRIVIRCILAWFRTLKNVLLLMLLSCTHLRAANVRLKWFSLS
jgi:hypothetical protein